MTQYTPGPWYQDKENYPKGDAVILGAKFTTICRVARTNQEANVRLIASAPALLEAAKAALPFIVVRFGASGDTQSMLRAAIAAAEAQGR